MIKTMIACNSCVSRFVANLKDRAMISIEEDLVPNWPLENDTTSNGQLRPPQLEFQTLEDDQPKLFKP